MCLTLPILNTRTALTRTNIKRKVELKNSFAMLYVKTILIVSQNIAQPISILNRVKPFFCCELYFLDL